MGCLITAGLTPSTCNQQTPGIKRDGVWVFNADEITAYGSVTAGEVNALTLALTKVGFKIDVHRNSAIFNEKLVTADNSGDSYTQELSFRILDDSTTTREAINAMKGAALVFVVRKKNGSFVVVGEDEGVRMTVNDKSSGAKAGDDVGDVITFTGDGFADKAHYFLDVDEATTITTLDALL